MNTDNYEPGAGTVDMLARNSIWIATRGAVAIVFGVVALLWRGKTLAQLAEIFGMYAIISGGLLLTAATHGRHENPPAARLASSGGINIIAGVLALLGTPGFTPLRFLVLVCFWAIVTGFVELAAAMRLSREVEHEWSLLPASVVSIILGVILMVALIPTVRTISEWIGWWAIVYGLFMIGLTVELRNSARAFAPTRSQAA
jgi:uncharacterized membrane protein HdeD (DUF308 family)